MNEKVFLHKVNTELMCLKKLDRQACLDEYKESIADRVECGENEDSVIEQLGSPQKISQDILTSYTEKEKGLVSRHISLSYIGVDAATLIFSYLIGYILCFQISAYPGEAYHLPFVFYMLSLLYILPLYMATYVLCGCYLFRRNIDQKKLVFSNVAANVCGLVVVMLILYFTEQIHFSRMMLYLFTLINLGICIFRKVVYVRVMT